MPGKDIQLPKIVNCEYCGIEVHRGDNDWRCTVPQLLASRALNTHWANCSKASEKIKASVRKSRGESTGAHIANSNCVCCGKVMRSDKIVAHIMAKHDNRILVGAMHKDERREALKYRLPVVKCYKEGSVLFRACLHCKRGALATSVAKVRGDETIFSIKRKEKHEECIAHFEDYQSLFEIEDSQADLPFHLYNCNNPDNPVKRNYITLDDEEPEARVYYIPVKDRKAIAEAEKEKPEVPVNEIIFHKEEEISTLKKRLEIQDRQIVDLESKMKSLEKAPPPTADSGLLEILPLLRQIAGDKYEEYDMEDLLDELKKYIARNTDLENALRKDYTRAMAKKDVAIAKLKKELEEKEEYIGALGTVSFGRGGQRIQAESDSDSS